MNRNERVSIFWYFVGPVAIIGIWWLLANVLRSPSSLLPDPRVTLAKFFSLIVSGNVLPDIWATVWRSAIGFILAAVVGVLLGLLMGSSRRVYRASFVVVDFFRSIPVTSLYPAFIWTLGVSHTSKIGMIFTACVFVIAVNSAYGIFHASPARRDMARLYGATPVQVFCWVSFWEALPHVMVGLRIAISYALIVAIVCEMFMGSNYGIGQRIIDAYTTFQIATLYALVLISGALGLVINRLFSLMEGRVVAWNR